MGMALRGGGFGVVCGSFLGLEVGGKRVGERKWDGGGMLGVGWVLGAWCGGRWRVRGWRF